MCGIAGIISSSSPDHLGQALDSMVTTLHHRGPDDRGTKVLAGRGLNAGLGHTRLSIIDLSTAGRQPMTNEDATIWITFNGEIYNHLDLRNVLMAKGHVFSSHTDTEAIVHGFEDYGDGIFSRLSGMFACGIWNSKTQTLHLARDRYGKKPLYYYHAGDTFVFASELKALLSCGEVSRKLDPEGLSRYLFYEYVPAPHSIIKGINKLMPGHVLTLKNNAVHIRPYWSIDFNARAVPVNEHEVVETILSKLKTSVARRLMSDVPLGVFLSGGIDSSAIVALMAELVDASRIKTFSIGFKEKTFDESEHARSIAALFGTDHHEQTLTPREVVDILPEVWAFMDEPFADASIIPTYLLSKFTRRTVTVALGGDGGDELFAGYDPFLAHRLAGLYDWMPGIIHKKLIMPLANLLPVSMDNMSLDFRIKQFLKGIPYPVPIRNQVWLGSFTPDEQRIIFSDDFRNTMVGFDPSSDIVAAERPMRFRDHTDEIVYLYSRFYLADDILTKVDRASMACSLEVRSPFLDVDFAEFVNSLPSRLKLRGLTRKYILKKSLEKKLPPQILHRRKKGFGIPLTKWIREDLRPMIADVFSWTKIQQAGIFNAASIQTLIDDHMSGTRDNRKQIWTLFMFEQWRNRYAPTL